MQLLCSNNYALRKQNVQVAVGALRKFSESKLGEQQRTLKNRCTTGNEEERTKCETARICKRLRPLQGTSRGMVGGGRVWSKEGQELRREGTKMVKRLPLETKTLFCVCAWQLGLGNEARRGRAFKQRELITVSREIIYNNSISDNIVVSRKDFCVWGEE